MKTALLLLALSFPAFSATVKVTSFIYPRAGQYYAELCGKVVEVKVNPTFVKVVVDPRTNRPGTYNTLVGSDGKFCLAVITYSGEAEATVFGEVNATFMKIK